MIQEKATVSAIFFFPSVFFFFPGFCLQNPMNKLWRFQLGKEKKRIKNLECFRGVIVL